MRFGHFDTAADQLHQIFVRTDNRHTPARVTRLMGQCRDDVVGLISLNFFACDIKGAGCVTGQGDLGAQILGHGIAVCFVLIIHVIAKCMAAFIKNDR